MKWKNVDWFAILIVVFVIVFCIGNVYFTIKSWDFESDKNTEVSISMPLPPIVEEGLNGETEEEYFCGVGMEENAPVYPLSDYDRWYIECMVAGEAKGESSLGKMAVAQCILNAMLKDNLTPQEVRKVYKYSGWDEHLESKNPKAYAEVKEAVWCVFDNGEVVTSENILWFYAPKYAEGKFHNTQNFVMEIGCHRFYSPKEEN